MKNQHDGGRAEPITDSATAVRNEVKGPAAESAGTVSLTGVVTDCHKLNVRARADPDADVVAVIPALTEVAIDTAASTEAFYKVCIPAGIEGFCMRKYIAVRR